MLLACGLPLLQAVSGEAMLVLPHHLSVYLTLAHVFLLLSRVDVCHATLLHALHGTCRRVQLSKNSMSVCCVAMNTQTGVGRNGRIIIPPSWLPGEWGPRGVHLGVLAGVTASSKVPT